jgi:Tfp pilus assembly protein PilV
MCIENRAMKLFYRIVNKLFTTLKSQAGMALAETLIAIAILGVSGAQTQLEVVQNAPYDSSGSSYTTIAAPANYTVSVASSTAVYSDTNIQKITVSVSHYAGLVYVLQGYKVNR